MTAAAACLLLAVSAGAQSTGTLAGAGPRLRRLLAAAPTWDGARVAEAGPVLPLALPDAAGAVVESVEESEDPDGSLSRREGEYRVLVADLDATARFSSYVDLDWLEQDLRPGDPFARFKWTQAYAHLEAVLEKVLSVLRGRAGRLDFTPGLGAGYYQGSGEEGVVRGWAVSLSQRLAYTPPKGRITLAVVHEASLGRLAFAARDERLSVQTFAVEGIVRLFPRR